MVTDAILAFLQGIINLILSILPAWNTVPDEEKLEGFRLVFWGLNGWAPITELAQIISLYSIVWAGMQGLKWSVKIYGMLRGSG